MGRACCGMVDREASGGVRGEGGEGSLVGRRLGGGVRGGVHGGQSGVEEDVMELWCSAEDCMWESAVAVRRNSAMVCERELRATERSVEVMGHGWSKMDEVEDGKGTKGRGSRGRCGVRGDEKVGKDGWRMGGGQKIAAVRVCVWYLG